MSLTLVKGTTYDLLTDLSLLDGVYGRPYDAWGSVLKYLPQGGDGAHAATNFTGTAVGSSTMIASLTAGKMFTITTGGTEYDGVNLQLKGEMCKFASGKPCYMGVKFTIDDATQSDFLIGLCETATVLLASSSAHAIGGSGIEGAFFYKLDGGTVLKAAGYENNAAVATVTHATAMDTSAHVYEILWDGTYARLYVDAVQLAEWASGSIGNGDLTPSIAVRAGSAAARTGTVDWMRVIQVV